MKNEKSYIAYLSTMNLLSERLNAKKHELAAWVFLEHEGLTAYLHANELNPPPKFYYGVYSCSDDSFIEPLMACWFKLKDIENFTPTERYITGKALIDRWSKNPDIEAKAYIIARIKESRLQDIHPLCGGTRISFPDFDGFPPLESGLFARSEVEQIELEDFANHQSRKRKANHSDKNPDWQKLANEAALSFKAKKGRNPTKVDVVKLLVPTLGKSSENIMRRIKKDW